MDKNWLAVYTKPRNEKAVADKLDSAGIEAYLPLTETIKQWSDRRKKVRVPLITSYVFVRVSEAERHQVLKIYGILNFVYWLGKPAIIRDYEIEQIKFLLKESDGCSIEITSLLPGDKALVTSGQFINESVTVLFSEKKEYCVILESLGVKLRLSKLSVEKALL